jgi:acyl-CoA synthetase (AMP-forming)/AMP-acid ligase II
LVHEDMLEAASGKILRRVLIEQERGGGAG